MNDAGLPLLEKVQRLCREGFIDCHKLKTTRNGQPVTEWLVNETLLRKRIEEHEQLLEDGVAILPPNSIGDVSKTSERGRSTQILGDNVAAPEHGGGAGLIVKDETNKVDQSDVLTTPDSVGGADLDEPSKASLMIENARLTAELEGAMALAAEIRDDKGFLREELRDVREGRKDVTKIAERMLEALEAMALGGKLHRLPIRRTDATDQISGQLNDGDISDENNDEFRI